MPSGAKKRKAAKKKKDKEANNINPAAITSHGNDDLKTQESDGGEVSSPVSQNNLDKPFNGEEKRDAPPVRSIVDENTSVEIVHNDVENAQKVVGEDEGVVQITRDWNIGQEPESKDVRIEHVESVKKAHNPSSSSSSSSSSRSSTSSDDESRAVDKTSVASESAKLKEEAYNPVSEGAMEEVTYVSENAPAGEAYNSVMTQTEHPVDSVKLVEPLTEIAPLQTIGSSDVAELGAEKKVEQLPSLEKNLGASITVIDIESKEVEDKVLPLSYVNGGGSSSANGIVTKENGDKFLQSSYAPILETSTCEESIKDSEIPEYSENQPLVAAAPRQVETTSWKSCCGLFEVLTGSNR